MQFNTHLAEDHYSVQDAEIQDHEVLSLEAPEMEPHPESLVHLHRLHFPSADRDGRRLNPQQAFVELASNDKLAT